MFCFRLRGQKHDWTTFPIYSSGITISLPRTTETKSCLCCSLWNQRTERTEPLIYLPDLLVRRRSCVTTSDKRCWSPGQCKIAPHVADVPPLTKWSIELFDGPNAHIHFYSTIPDPQFAQDFWILRILFFPLYHHQSSSLTGREIRLWVSKQMWYHFSDNMTQINNFKLSRAELWSHR